MAWSRDELKGMTRKEIQALAKQKGVKANLKTAVIIEALLEKAEEAAPAAALAKPMDTETAPSASATDDDATARPHDSSAAVADDNAAGVEREAEADTDTGAGGEEPMDTDNASPLKTTFTRDEGDERSSGEQATTPDKSAAAPLTPRRQWCNSPRVEALPALRAPVVAAAAAGSATAVPAASVAPPAGNPTTDDDDDTAARAAQIMADLDSRCAAKGVSTSLASTLAVTVKPVPVKAGTAIPVLSTATYKRFQRLHKKEFAKDRAMYEQRRKVDARWEQKRRAASGTVHDRLYQLGKSKQLASASRTGAASASSSASSSSAAPPTTTAARPAASSAAATKRTTAPSGVAKPPSSSRPAAAASAAVKSGLSRTPRNTLAGTKAGKAATRQRPKFDLKASLAKGALPWQQSGGAKRAPMAPRN